MTPHRSTSLHRRPPSCESHPPRLAPRRSAAMSSVLSTALLLLGLSPPTAALTGKVLLVSFDGFRWDYTDVVPGLRHFPAVAAQGAHARYMNNTFTTMTFPTHYSMATGLYQESHGIISNYMYDPVFKEEFSPGCASCLDQKWWLGEPIWITATRQGKKAGCLYWPGTEVEFDGLLPAFVEEYSTSMPFKTRVDTVLDWFSDEDIDLGTVYFHQPDKAGHKFGPRSPEVAEQVRIADEVLGYMMDEIKARELNDELNVIIVSDHGVANMSYDRIIEVPLYVNMSLVERFVEVGAVCHVFPKEGQLAEVYQQLSDAHPHMTAYRREEVPQRWHYSHNRRIGEVLLVIDEHWSCTENKELSWNHDKGNHGYDNRLLSMKPIFIAKGPDIKENFEVDPFMSLDIYPLTAALLNINPAPNNGTLDIVGAILKESQVPVSVPVKSGSAPSTSLAPFSNKLLCLLLFRSILSSLLGQ